MAGLKVFLALCCVAATSAVQLERKPFKRLIPADVLRGESTQFILEYQTNLRRCRFDVPWGELGYVLSGVCFCLSVFVYNTSLVPKYLSTSLGHKNDLGCDLFVAFI